MPDLEDLVVPTTEEEIAERMLNLSEDNDLPVTSWHNGALWKVLHAIIPELFVDAFLASAKIANGVILGLSRGRWVDVVHGSWFDEDRKLPQVTVGEVILTDNGGGPHPAITAGTITVADSLGHLYTNDNGGTLGLNGSLTLSFHAAAAGSAYNVPNQTITRLVTTLSTVTVSNPAIGSTGTWITTLGADIESDAAYQARMPLKWATLATGSPPGAYQKWALDYEGVTRATVDDANPDGPNTVRVYIDSAAAVSGLQTWLSDNRKIPSGTSVLVVLATTETVDIPCVITVRKSLRAAAEAKVTANISAYQALIDIGGIVVKSEIIEQIMTATGVTDVSIGSGWDGTPNLQLGSTAIPSLVLDPTWVEV